jgi:hypothetical protein
MNNFFLKTCHASRTSQNQSDHCTSYPTSHLCANIMMIQLTNVLLLLPCLPLSISIPPEAIPWKYQRQLQRNIFDRESPQLRRVDHSMSSKLTEENTLSFSRNQQFMGRDGDGDNELLLQTIRKRSLGVGAMSMKDPSLNNAEDHAIVNEGLGAFLNQILMSMNTSVSFVMKSRRPTRNVRLINFSFFFTIGPRKQTSICTFRDASYP